MKSGVTEDGYYLPHLPGIGLLPLRFATILFADIARADVGTDSSVPCLLGLRFVSRPRFSVGALLHRSRRSGL